MACGLLCLGFVIHGAPTDEFGRLEPVVQHLPVLRPRAPIDFSQITIDLAKDLYYAYGTGASARPNTPYSMPPDLPSPANQNERIGTRGSGGATSGSAVPGSSAGRGTAPRANTPALSPMPVNSGYVQ
ncbi:hypothetical protein BDZ91DRAFT_850101 [Kalaharituber pfeilii]|nr:hypothetical protein BDZ91DRAFT_850101 [Kalaharituber pfeilii]